MAKRNFKELKSRLGELEVTENELSGAKPVKLTSSAARNRILNFLRTGRRLNRIISWEELGIFDCPSRIAELSKLGFNIERGKMAAINRYNETRSISFYRLIDPTQEV